MTDSSPQPQALVLVLVWILILVLILERSSGKSLLETEGHMGLLYLDNTVLIWISSISQLNMSDPGHRIGL